MQSTYALMKLVYDIDSWAASDKHIIHIPGPSRRESAGDENSLAINHDTRWGYPADHCTEQRIRLTIQTN